MLQVGFGELILVLVVALVVLGPDKLPHAAEKLGKAYRAIRHLRHKLSDELSDLSESDQKKPND